MVSYQEPNFQFQRFQTLTINDKIIDTSPLLTLFFIFFFASEKNTNSARDQHWRIITQRAPGGANKGSICFQNYIGCHKKLNINFLNLKCIHDHNPEAPSSAVNNDLVRHILNSTHKWSEAICPVVGNISTHDTKTIFLSTVVNCSQSVFFLTRAR